jgi:pimeloyl-ACP methyl ester carboxylesterase
VAERLQPRVAGILLIGAVGLTDRPFGRPREIRRWRHIEDRDALRQTQRHNLELLLFGDAAKVDELAVDVQIECTRLAKTRRASREPHSLPALRASGARFGGLWGERDATACDGVGAVRDALRSVNGSAPFEVIPGAGHWVAWEAADAVNRLIPDLFDRMRRDA